MPLTNTDTNFWWLRNFCGLVLPVVLAVWGIYSIVTRHSCTVSVNIGISGQNWIAFLPVEGKQAILMGVAYLGVALMFFANCYAQYNEKMGFYYQWLLVPGALLAGGGIAWCAWSTFSG